MIGIYASCELVANVICALLYGQQKCVPAGSTVVVVLSRAWPEGICSLPDLPVG